jgi:hypothetical protein
VKPLVIPEEATTDDTDETDSSQTVAAGDVNELSVEAKQAVDSLANSLRMRRV